MNSKSLTLNSHLVEDYADVSLYIEEKKVFSCVKANKLILALNSPYFHRMFQCSKESTTFHVGFVGASNSAMRDAIRLMYGESIAVQENNSARFKSFLKQLEIDCEDDAVSPVPKKPKVFENESGKEMDTSSYDGDDLECRTSLLQSKDTDNVEVVPKKDEISSTQDSYKVDNENLSRICQQALTIPFLDNCTKTSETGLEEDLGKVDFKLGSTNSKGQHQEYICCHCEMMVKSIGNAKESCQKYPKPTLRATTQTQP